MNKVKNNSPKKETEIINIPIEQVKPNPFAQRKKFDEEGIKALAESITDNGLIQPIVVRKTDDGKYYEVIAGERRLIASKLANMETVPAIVVYLDDDTMAKIYALDTLDKEINGKDKS